MSFVSRTNSRKGKNEIMLNKILGNLHYFINWHLRDAVATMPVLEEHFNLTDGEIAMLEACIDYKLLKEYVKFNKDRSKAYIVLRVREVRKLINLRRRNIRN